MTANCGFIGTLAYVDSWTALPTPILAMEPVAPAELQKCLGLNKAVLEKKNDRFHYVHGFVWLLHILLFFSFWFFFDIFRFVWYFLYTSLRQQVSQLVTLRGNWNNTPRITQWRKMSLLNLLEPPLDVNSASFIDNIIQKLLIATEE